MSAFLGPIHYWLFNKIKLVEAREGELTSAFAAKYGDEINSIAEANRAKYGDNFGDTPIEELIGDSPIHTYLAGAIEKVETREAALLAELIKKYGAEAEVAAKEVAHSNGEKVGKAEAAEISDGEPTADDVLKGVKNTFLDGMPCDHASGIEDASETQVTETHSECLHINYWKAAGAPEAFMCEYLGSWIDGFVSSVKARHRRGKTLAKGDTHCEDIYEVDQA